MEYFAVIKKNERCHLQPTWMDLDVIVINAVSQREKDMCSMISHMWNLKR